MATKAVSAVNLSPTSQPIPEDSLPSRFPSSSSICSHIILGVVRWLPLLVVLLGHNKYEAYLKSLIATGFTLPKKNILLSVGSFKEKRLLSSVLRDSTSSATKLFATAGTSDFIQEHGITRQVP